MAFAGKLCRALLLSATCACIEGTSELDAPPGFGTIEEAEPNDGPDRARLLIFGDTAHGAVARGDRDWWRVDLSAGDMLSMQVLGLRLDQGGWGSNTPTLRVFGPDGAALFVQDSAGESAHGWGALDPDLPALRAESDGPHYVCIGASDEGRSGGEYVLALNALGPELQLEIEPAGLSGINDSAAEAQHITAGVLHGFHVDGEQDWYRLDVLEPNLLSFVVLAHRNGIWGGGDRVFDPELALYDAELRQLASNDDGLFGDSFLTWVSSRPTTLFLRVGQCCPGGDAPYFLIHDARPLDTALEEREPNDGPSAAPYVQFDRLYLGNLGPDDPDTFALPCFAGDRVELWLHDVGRHDQASAAVRVTLENGLGRRIAMDRGTALGVRTFRITEDDTLFLRLSSAQGSPYAFELRMESSVFESEPNDLAAQPGRLHRTRGAAGRIQVPGDVDLFEFEALAGIPVLLECFADDEFGSHGYDEFDGDGSDLDPLLEVRDSQARLIARSSALERTALGVVHGRSTVSVAFLPRVTGTYILAVRDARGGSGPTHTYAIKRH